LVPKSNPNVFAITFRLLVGYIYINYYI
jgi:hypothetical protein